MVQRGIWKQLFTTGPTFTTGTIPRSGRGLTEAVLGALAAHQKGIPAALPVSPEKQGILSGFNSLHSLPMRYINGYQVAYSVLTNVDGIVQMQREQSVTYESLPGFVAKYRVGQDLSLKLLEGNRRFIEYFGDGENGENPLHLKISRPIGLQFRKIGKSFSVGAGAVRDECDEPQWKGPLAAGQCLLRKLAGRLPCLSGHLYRHHRRDGASGKFSAD